MAEAQNRFDFEWVRFVGAQMIEAADGRCVMRLRPTSVHLNHNGSVNAPILYGLAEFAGAGAVTTGMTDLLTTAYVVVRRATIDYLAPAHDTVTAVGTASRRPSRQPRPTSRPGSPSTSPLTSRSPTTPAASPPR